MEFVSGESPTTQMGHINKHNQKCLGHRNVKGTDNLQRAYKTKCLDCEDEYGSNGSDLFERKCPSCQDGAPGIDF